MGRRVEYRETLAELVVCQAMNGNGEVITLEEQKLFRVQGEAKRTAINSIFVVQVV